MVIILLPDDSEKFCCPDSGHLEAHNLHIWNLISKRFKPLGELNSVHHLRWSKRLYLSFEFSTISPEGRIKSTILIVFQKTDEILFPFKTKNLKPTAMGLNSTPIKRWVFRRIEKKVVRCGLILSHYKRHRIYSIISPISGGKSVFPNLETSLSRFRRIELSS